MITMFLFVDVDAGVVQLLEAHGRRNESFAVQILRAVAAIAVNEEMNRQFGKAGGCAGKFSPQVTSQSSRQS